MNKVLHSSESVEWATPQSFFDELNKELAFTLDPCATKENAKCAKFYTKAEDGLIQDWTGERVFCNPPYGDPEYPCKKVCQKKICAKRGRHNSSYLPGVRDWVEKLRRGGASVAVGLLPARTDTRWFHEHILGIAEVRFIKGRLKFGGAKNSAPFPSMVVVWRNGSYPPPVTSERSAEMLE